jgi:hypothetical protein
VGRPIEHLGFVEIDVLEARFESILKKSALGNR